MNYIMDLLDYLLYGNIGFIFLNALKDTFFFLSSLVLLFFVSDLFFYLLLYIKYFLYRIYL